MYWATALGSVPNKNIQDSVGVDPPSGLAHAATPIDHFCQSVCATDGSGLAEGVARSFLQQPRLQQWAAKLLRLAGFRLFPARGTDRSIVACDDALIRSTKLSRQRPPPSKYINSVAFVALCPTWPAALESKPTPLRTSGWRQRLAPLGHGFSVAPRNVLPDDVAPCNLRTNG